MFCICVFPYPKKDTGAGKKIIHGLEETDMLLVRKDKKIKQVTACFLVNEFNVSVCQVCQLILIVVITQTNNRGIYDKLLHCYIWQSESSLCQMNDDSIIGNFCCAVLFFCASCVNNDECQRWEFISYSFVELIVD